MGIQLSTFGGLHVYDGISEMELSQRSRLALLTYLTIERRVARDALAAMFWPESDAPNAHHALRQGLYHLTKVMHGRQWIESRAYELAVCGDVTTDATEFMEAAERGDKERAVRLYRGSFLDGVHLVNLQSWESWVDLRRAKYARVFRKACRELLDAKVAAGDLTGALAVGERWIAPDPTDDEAQHRLISTLAIAGERGEAIRQFETYARLIAPNGLEPLDETRILIEQLRIRRQYVSPERARALRPRRPPSMPARNPLTLQRDRSALGAHKDCP
jgi:DNA-binding SARP family transcriptional activator